MIRGLTIDFKIISINPVLVNTAKIRQTYVYLGHTKSSESGTVFAYRKRKKISFFIKR
jgi:hypothetical protein